MCVCARARSKAAAMDDPGRATIVVPFRESVLTW
jgi:hypothetical protein